MDQMEFELKFTIIGMDLVNMDDVLRNAGFHKQADDIDVQVKSQLNMEKESTEMYYVRNAGFVGNAFIWWAKDRSGYTTEINNAHKFTLEEVKRACERPEDTAFKCRYIDGLTDAKKTIIDSQYVDRVEELFKPIK